MESTPVGVVVGLFQAISQKLPSFSDWETQKHHHLLNSNPDVCNTMTEVRQHVTRYGKREIVETTGVSMQKTFANLEHRELPSQPLLDQI